MQHASKRHLCLVSCPDNDEQRKARSSLGASAKRINSHWWRLTPWNIYIPLGSSIASTTRQFNIRPTASSGLVLAVSPSCCSPVIYSIRPMQTIMPEVDKVARPQFWWGKRREATTSKVRVFKVKLFVEEKQTSILWHFASFALTIQVTLKYYDILTHRQYPFANHPCVQ